jgi:Arm DNA-binding domain
MMSRRRKFTDQNVFDLKPRAERYLCPDPLTTNLYIRVQPSGIKSFIVMAREPTGKQRWVTLGRANNITISEARIAAAATVKHIESGLPLAVKLEPALALHDRVAAKFVSFLEQGIEPEGYLYRHFEPNGDLLYVGITLSILKRTETHRYKAKWREFICLILVEPFATREELLEAEREAILNEFPKYNRVLNKHRHPVQEMAKRLTPSRNSKKSIQRQTNDQRYRNVLARRAAEAAAALNSGITTIAEEKPA